ncbi:MAG TPA: MBL fold metallo-hydrolase [Burkholderiaceae bacterium]|nr:MBL fold metallo-hydrolase [Burkholderiaceae bacterium]
MKVTFLGAADAVTGSRHLIDTDDRRLLLDCGLFQGYKNLRERNWGPLGVPPHTIDAVLLSHAHLDHSGYIPALVRQGFKGQIFSTPATRKLCEVLLADSAHLMEEDARRANRTGSSRHEKALPLYTLKDAQRALSHFVGLPRDGRLKLGSNEIRFTPAGHLLGAACITVQSEGRRLVFSGDLGRARDLMLPPPQPLEEADVLLVESTYGNRRHPPEDVQERLGRLIRATMDRGGSVLLPSFAVGRAQALLLVLQRLRAAGEIPGDLPIFLDSPMAREATDITLEYKRLLKVSPGELSRLCEGVRMVSKPQESLKTAQAVARRPGVVISASGMATGGRVLNYLQVMAPQSRHHICFAGFQVGGTRGAKMVDGAREIKIRGEFVPIAAEVSHLEGFSGHADGEELMAWLRHFRRPPSQTFVVHGEPQAADALRSRIQDELGWTVRVPQHGETVEV